MTQLITDNLILIVAFVSLLVGFAMGRTSSGHPIRAERADKKPKKVKAPKDRNTDSAPHHDAEGGYINDALLDPEDVNGRG